MLNLAENKNYFPKQVSPEEFAAQLKIAFAVGTRISKSAVVRNRLRRQLREILRLRLANGELRAGYYLLVLPKKDALKKNYAELKQELELLLGRSSLAR